MSKKRSPGGRFFPSFLSIVKVNVTLRTETRHRTCRAVQNEDVLDSLSLSTASVREKSLPLFPLPPSFLACRGEDKAPITWRVSARWWLREMRTLQVIPLFGPLVPKYFRGQWSRYLTSLLSSRLHSRTAISSRPLPLRCRFCRQLTIVPPLFFPFFSLDQ